MKLPPLPWRTLLAGALLIVCASTGPDPARAQPDYPEQLVARANRLDLHHEKYWGVLLHYAKTYTGGYRSRISDPRFFLSGQGRTEPRLELEETIRSFFLAPGRDGEHALCRYPARYAFLKERLDIDPAQLPSVTCTERDSIFQTVDPTSAVLVFPVGHINSPASMFGHTLLRIDGKSRSNLISYAANYAAVTTDANGLVYAWKGIFGGYRGYYSLLPYYLKVKEYSDLEHRDMWEYPLKLSEPEVRRMLAHLWELQTIASDYYFFDENCSYNLLFLIDAAKPELGLAEKMGLWVLPSDTIDAAARGDILGKPRYRPSQGTKIRRIAARLPDPARAKAFQVARGGENAASVHDLGLPVEQEMQVLDLAADFLQYRFARKELEKEEYNRNYLRILTQRSRLGDPKEEQALPEPDPPEKGHGSFKVAGGAGVRRSDPYLQLRLQPVYHDLLDPDQGYLPGAQIKFLETSLLYNLAKEELELKTLHILDIVSLSPRDLFFRPFSWKAVIGFDREAMRDGRDALLFRINTGGGFAHASPFGGITYLLAEADLNAGDRIRGTATVGPALTVGDLEQIGDRWKVLLFLRGATYRVGDDRNVVKGAVEQSFRVSRHNTVRLELSQEYVNGHGIFEAALLWNRFF